VSTFLYLECLDHTPGIIAEGESGQHLSDLTQIRLDIANREQIVKAWEADDFHPADHFHRNTVCFLSAHPSCDLAIVDEYGREHSTHLDAWASVSATRSSTSGGRTSRRTPWRICARPSGTSSARL